VECKLLDIVGGYGNIKVETFLNMPYLQMPYCVTRYAFNVEENLQAM
jgi:hypothetical protein